MQGAERLEVLRVRALHMQLQRVGQLVVFVEEGFTDGGNPLVGIRIEVTIYRFASPLGDVFQIDDVVIRTTIHEGSDFSIADGERFLEISCGLVIL